jgi:hypothetical protein
MHLITHLEEALKKASDKGFKKTNLVMSVMIEPAQFYAAMTGRRPFSDGMLEKLASIPQLETTYAHLLLLKFLDNYGPDTLDEFVDAALAWRRGLSERSS